MKPNIPDARCHNLRSAVRIALAASALSSLVIPHAQAAEEETELEQIVVTGSRIASANMTSTSPILSVTSDEIRNSGRVDLTDVLNQLPQINSNSLGQDLGNRTSGLNSAGGVATADLRGLGPNRTLVLVDGRRLGQGSPQTVISSPAPDIDQIPAALIDRVEVVTGGASAVYGSDAIAGVVNFITKKDFEGIQLDAQLGGNWHNNHNSFAQSRVADAGYPVLKSTDWDGTTTSFSITAGANIMEGRGNVTGFFGYQSMKPVTSAQRDFGGCQMFFNAAYSDLECSGSGNSNWFEPKSAVANPDGNVYAVQGNQFIEWGSADTNPPAFYNAQNFIYMQRQNKRYNAGFLAHVDVNDFFKPYAEVSFMNDKTHQEVAETALFRDSNVLTDDGNYLVNCSNPLLSAQQALAMCTPQQIADDLAEPGSASASVRIGRRNLEGGPRTYDYEHTNYRLVGGARGSLGEAWNYDAYSQYFYTSFANTNGKDFSFDKIANALQVTTDPDSGDIVCISGGACEPYNIFEDGGVTPEALRYLETLGSATGSTALRTFHADVTGNLGVYGVQLPTADEGVGINVGYEFRRETVKYIPDAAYESGLIVGTGGAYPRMDNSLSVKDYFAEVRVPIAQGRPGIHDLVADAGYRYSDYSSGVTADTYKFEMQYAPIEDFRFRASYNRAIRAPQIVELYVPQLVGKIAFGEDPCAPSEDDGTLAATFEQCARTGVTQAQYDNESIPQGTAGQLTQLQGGNPDLKAERADTYTVGLTVRPAALPDFTGSIDYFHIKLKDSIGALDAQIIMNNCLNTGDPLYCSQLIRNPATGSLNGASVASGGYIAQTNVNIGAGVLDGIDMQAAYRMDLGGAFGKLRFLLNGAYQLKNVTTPFPGGESYDCVGLFGPTCQTVNPKWRHNALAAWQLPHGVTVNTTWRFIGKVHLDNNDSNPLLFGSSLRDDDGAPVRAGYRKRIGSVSYFDLTANWEFNEHLQVRGGINNLLDRDPPLAPTEIISGGAPNYYEYYDGLGRQVFLAVTARF